MTDIFATAVAYESMMGRWSARLAPLFMDFAKVRDGGRVLDVGCGTGSLVRTVAGMTRQSEIVGIDPFQPFIDYSRTQFAGPRITFDSGNALDLPYAADSFDYTLSLLVFMFIRQPEKAASEMRRVTRPGGTAAACTWDHDGFEMSSIFWGEANRMDPDAEAQSKRPRRANRKGQLAALWNAAGLDQVEETTLEIRMDFSSFDDYWQPHLKGLAPQGAYVASLPLERRETLRHALRKRLLADRPDGAFSLRAKALAVRGIVPKAQ